MNIDDNFKLKLFKNSPFEVFQLFANELIWRKIYRGDSIAKSYLVYPPELAYFSIPSDQIE